jgi:hypothetical protein
MGSAYFGKMVDRGCPATKSCNLSKPNEVCLCVKTWCDVDYGYATICLCSKCLVVKWLMVMLHPLFVLGCFAGRFHLFLLLLWIMVCFTDCLSRPGGCLSGYDSAFCTMLCFNVRIIIAVILI